MSEKITGNKRFSQERQKQKKNKIEIKAQKSSLEKPKQNKSLVIPILTDNKSVNCQILLRLLKMYLFLIFGSLGIFPQDKKCC